MKRIRRTGEALGRWQASAAFTLVELMIVCAIIGMVLTIAIPTIYRHFHPDSLEGTVRTMMEACSHARARAILNGTYSELVIKPLDRTFSVVEGASSSTLERSIVEVAASQNRLESRSVSGENWRMPERGVSTPSASREVENVGGKISDRVVIEMIDVNFVEHKDADVARVRFYPNGTSDEFTIVLHGENDQWRKISLEVVTGLPDLSSDPGKWMKY